jgi:hypothetical protein
VGGFLGNPCARFAPTPDPSPRFATARGGGENFNPALHLPQ